jgi:hypothetical protein
MHGNVNVKLETVFLINHECIFQNSYRLIIRKELWIAFCATEFMEFRPCSEIL